MSFCRTILLTIDEQIVNPYVPPSMRRETPHPRSSSHIFLSTLAWIAIRLIWKVWPAPIQHLLSDKFGCGGILVDGGEETEYYRPDRETDCQIPRIMSRPGLEHTGTEGTDGLRRY